LTLRLGWGGKKGWGRTRDLPQAVTQITPNRQLFTGKDWQDRLGERRPSEKFKKGKGGGGGLLLHEITKTGGRRT